MGLLGWIIAGAVLFAGAVALSRRQKQKVLEAKRADEQLLLEDSQRILDLQIGDAIEYFGSTWLVDSTLLYDEEGTVWKTYLLGGADDGKDRWLSVEDDDRLEVSLFEVLPPGTIPIADPAPPSLTVGELTFHLADKGSARVRKRDDKGTRDRGQCRYADYEGPDGAHLSVEWWGEAPETALGQRLDPDSLMILPGS